MNPQIRIDLPESPAAHRPTIFSSFWMAGFESACHVKSQRRAAHRLAATQHDALADAGCARWGSPLCATPFHELRETYARYRRPIFIGETSHVGSGCAEWLREMAEELCRAIDAGHLPLPDHRPLRVGRPVALAQQRALGLERSAEENFVRVLNDDYAAELW